MFVKYCTFKHLYFKGAVLFHLLLMLFEIFFYCFPFKTLYDEKGMACVADTHFGYKRKILDLGSVHSGTKSFV